MSVIHDTRHTIPTDVQDVWNLMTWPSLRARWMPGVASARLVEGEIGVRGAVIELEMDNGEAPVRMKIRRAREPERLQLSFDAGGCHYSQVIWLVRADENLTELHYHCKRELQSTWRKLLPIPSSVHPIAAPAAFERLIELAGRPLPSLDPEASAPGATAS